MDAPSGQNAWDVADYPPMTHPLADPLTHAKVARQAGVKAMEPASARIMEIGCGEGHHLLSLASRWRGASLVGVDAAAKAIRRAKSRAVRAGLRNVVFHESRLSAYEAGEPFDYVIAHGFFSWVPDEVKVGMMDWMARNLAPGGVAVVSFNVAAGWRKRMPIVAKARAILAAGATDVMQALAILRTVVESEEEQAIVDDMQAKGPAILAHDDFAPVMDAWSLGAVVKLAEESGLRWLGDSVSGEKGDDEWDRAAGTTFRSELFCRGDVDLCEGLPPIRELRVSTVIPDFPKLDSWRMTCAREALPVPDGWLKPCSFTTDQYKVLIAMDGTRSVYELSRHAREVAPNLDFVSWLRHVADRGILDH